MEKLINFPVNASFISSIKITLEFSNHHATAEWREIA
jgi:hypothetical protein